MCVAEAVKSRIQDFECRRTQKGGQEISGWAEVYKATIRDPPALFCTRSPSFFELGGVYEGFMTTENCFME